MAVEKRKGGPGRKPLNETGPMKNRMFRTDDKTMEVLRRAGGGNAAAGLRRAAEMVAREMAGVQA